MGKLKLDVQALKVATFAVRDDVSVLAANALGKRDTLPCSRYPSYCLLECGTETISYDGPCGSS